MAEPNSPQPPANTNQPPAGEPAKPASTPDAGAAPDLKTMTGDQLAAVLENPELWKTPRMKELLDKSGELKKLKADQEAASEKSLAEQKKFEELANKRGEENDALKKQLQQNAIDQALTTVLVGSGVVDLDGALKLADRAKISVDDNGTVAGVDDALNALKTDKAYLFNNKPSGTSVGSPTNPTNSNEGGGPAKFKVSQLQDREFYVANREEILKAHKAGLIEDDTR